MPKINASCVFNPMVKTPFSNFYKSQEIPPPEGKKWTFKKPINWAFS